MQIYVSANVVRSGDGSRIHPFKSISEAANIAMPGDRILVGPGLYRESVDPKRGGTEDQRIEYISSAPGGAIISGAEEISGFKYFEENTYKVLIPDSFFGSFNPFKEKVHGDWFSRNASAHLGEVFIDGKAMYEVTSLEECLHPVRNNASWDPDFTLHTWYTQSEDNMTAIYANFQGEKTENHCIEITVRPNCFYPSKTGINYITVSGFQIRQAATQWAPPTAVQEGMIGPHWSKGWIIEECEIYDSKCSGISLGKYYQPGNDNKWTSFWKKDGTQTQRDAVCQAVNDGWDKETVGSHIIRRCDIHDCGQTGIVGHMGGVFSVIEDNHIHHINNRQNLAGAEIGGIKMHAAIDVIIRRNHIDHCTRGLWLDWQAQGTRVTQNLFHDNVPPKNTLIKEGLALGEDIFIEVSHGPTLIDHNLLLSDISCRISTQGIAFVHNLIMGAFTYVGSGTGNGGKKFATDRYTPYHVPHSTKIAGFMTILHGDARFYNNIFIQKKIRQDLMEYIISKNADTLSRNNMICGTKPYDNYPTPEHYFSGLGPDTKKKNGNNDAYYDHLPVYTGGNAYFNGALPCNIEKCAFVDDKHKVSVELMEKEGRYTLRTNLYEYLPRNMTIPVSHDILGMAFEPEQFFENPDGSPVEFNEDYFGRGRGIYPLCGPFEEGVSDRVTVAFPPYDGKAIAEAERKRIETAKVTADKVIILGEKDDSSDNSDEAENKADNAHKENISYEATEDQLEENSENLTDNGNEEETIDASALKDIEDDLGMHKVQANLTITNCHNVNFPFEGSLFIVSDMFVRGNMAWLLDMKNHRLVEVDCEYGIYRNIKSWEISSMQSADAMQDINMIGLTQTVGTLLCILSRSMEHDPEDACETIRNKVNNKIEPSGITMRFTPRYLKFIQNKRFITLEDVIYRIGTGPMDIVTEVIKDS
ncbi:MAG: right-handed parallel beta-helix repeat-containing protein [Butyrivibrio sp.]|nr:right-handed parallel beta-helix repeat-containing protein [Butyrivibrio sp.]